MPKAVAAPKVLEHEDALYKVGQTWSTREGGRFVITDIETNDRGEPRLIVERVLPMEVTPEFLSYYAALVDEEEGKDQS